MELTYDFLCWQVNSALKAELLRLIAKMKKESYPVLSV
jgi:hypothetical protein